MSVVIQVEHLSKHYRLGLIGGGTLRDDLHRWWAKARGRPDPLLKIGQEDDGNREGAELWALRDVSFEVHEGEILGIIGRNGAGKSTLLKILSRITAPTTGQVKIKGRVGSLLEVGTGFHPELTGRENVYLNGAILGMKKAEIDGKLDEIIDFAEIEPFIDTPVKRYSSGMYVRLAFAVAAHLEPEILVVDEVLAVGDAAFQSKCMGKMNDISGHGRTILFVSHNMQAVQNLCSHCILIKCGRLDSMGRPDQIVAKYLSSTTSLSNRMVWESPAGLGKDSLQLHRIVVASEDAMAVGGLLPSARDIIVEMSLNLKQVSQGLCIGFDLLDRQGNTVLRSYDTDYVGEPSQGTQLAEGKSVVRCIIPKGLLNAGQYLVAPRIGLHNKEWIVHEEPLVGFEVVLNHGVSPFWNTLDSTNRPGLISPILVWQRREINESEKHTNQEIFKTVH